MWVEQSGLKLVDQFKENTLFGFSAANWKGS